MATGENTNTKRDALIKFARRAFFVLLSAAFGLAFVFLLGKTSREVGVLRMSMSMQYSAPGRTEFSLAPVGRITARTHSLPVAFVLGVEEISISGARKMVSKGWDVRKILGGMKRGGIKLVILFILKIFFLAALGGALGAAVGRKITARRLFAGGASGAAAAALLFAAVAAQYNPAAFNDIEYSGALNDVSAMLPELQESLLKGVALKDRLSKIPESLARFYVGDKSAGKAGGKFIRVLHISDLHNNPVAAGMVCRLNSALKPDVIADTGDITDIGIPLELHMINSLQCLDKPHLFVSGNHDLPKVVDEMKTRFGATVLDGNMVEVAGLRIIGFANPPPFRRASVEAAASHKTLQALRDRMNATLASLPAKPDILMVHYPAVSNSVAGKVPVILNGHSHEPSARIEDGSLIVNSGSTGASGARYFLNTKDTPKYTVALITFKKTSGRPVPLYADLIRLNEHTGNFSLRRTSLAKEMIK